MKTSIRKKIRVVAAMSGGVDSAVAAAILKNDGFDVVGVTLKTFEMPDCSRGGSNRCCSLRDIEDARAVAAHLGIAHYVMDFSREFKKHVIDYFVSEYLRARTPNPCIVCNTKIKFGLLLEKARRLGAQYLATGHYARKHFDASSGRYALREATDLAKDQSYVLFDLNQNQLSRTLLPLGDLSKPDVRDMASRLGLQVSQKPDSQEICFVDDDYGRFLNKVAMQSRPGRREGEFIDGAGRVLGHHQGCHLFTIGQRKGIGLTSPRPYYVIRLEPDQNRVVVGFEEDTYFSQTEVARINWLIPLRKKSCDIKIRSRHHRTKAYLTQIGIRRALVRFDEPQKAVTPGQAAVFYDNDVVVGGGWIERAWAASKTNSQKL